MFLYVCRIWSARLLGTESVSMSTPVIPATKTSEPTRDANAKPKRPSYGSYRSIVCMADMSALATDYKQLIFSRAMREGFSVPPGGLPPLNALRVFEAVVRTGSITAAAGELCVTPSAISHQL